MDILQLSCNASMEIRSLREGNELTSTMKSGVLVVGDIFVSFVLQKRIYGRFNVGQKIDRIMLNVHDQHKTRFTEAGYLSVQCLFDKDTQVKLYLTKENLQKMVTACCYASIEKKSIK